MAVNHIPDGYHAVTSYFTVKGADRLLEFVKAVFGAKEVHRMNRSDGTIGHAELRIGDSVIMLSEANTEWPANPGGVYVYVPDVDATYQKALAAGATSLRAPEDQFYGDRGAGIRDASGVTWWIGTHVEDVSPAEMQKRMAAATRKTN